jgi:hypothetical protein
VSLLLFSLFSSCSSLKKNGITTSKVIAGFVFDKSMSPLPGTVIKVKDQKKKKATAVLMGNLKSK